jgi:hypothetical protein
MASVWISWSTAALLALAAAAVVAVTRTATHRLLLTARATCRELTIVLSLYSVWRVAHHLTIRQVTGASEHARWVIDLERHLHLANELQVQRTVLEHPLLTQALNLFYAGAHVPVLLLTLVWLFARHRGHYGRVRNALALLTAASLLMHLFPVAPPRLLPELGFVDAGLRYGQSVYGPGMTGLSNQLAALPSLHVGWALVVAFAVVSASTSRWRWLVVLHPALTCWAVVATGNHWWLDGIVAAGLLVAAVALQDAVAGLRRDRGAIGEAPVVGPDVLARAGA